MSWEILPESRAAFDRMERRFADSLRQEKRDDSARSHCCYIEQGKAILLSDGWSIEDVPCVSPAEWEIVHGPTVDDYTHACTAHVGALLTDAPEHRIYPIAKESA